MSSAAIEFTGHHGASAKRQDWWARLKRRFADWVATDAPEADPTAGFSSREWADLPTHHPVDER